MLKKSVVPADTFIVVNDTVLNDNDRKLLIMLYQPVIGSLAVNLYFALWSYLDKTEIMSIEWTHHHLVTNMRLKLEDIIIAREKLEAIGLLKTYVNNREVNNFIYKMYSPLSAKDFFENPILSITLKNNVGSKEYKQIKEYFTVPKINLSSYEEITCKFSDVFEMVNVNKFSTLVDDIKTSKRNNLNFFTKLNLDNTLSNIPEELLDIKNINPETKELIYNLSFVYNLEDESMSELIKISISKRKIDEGLLKENCRKYYQFENSSKLPSLAYKNQPEYLRKEISNKSNRDKLIYQFEMTSPHDFLLAKQKGKKLTNYETEILSYLLVDMNLKPGVVNVILDYILKESNNKLIKSFVEMIATQFSRSKIETVEEAMNLASMEHHQKKKPKTKKEEIKPKWFDSDIKEKEATKEEEEAMEALLSKFN